MTVTEEAQTYAGRLESFKSEFHAAKRRASTTKKRGQASLTWPATAPAAEEMAKAGFFFAPSATNPDNAMCFVCQRQLDGWEQDDNPALEHLTHSPDCGWAINVCISLSSGDPERIDEDAMSERMVEARTSTFLGKWPHEHKKAWKCKTKKMVEAGWCYDPSPENDDGATCFYCNLSLDGWEPKDNPLEEHQKRSPDCAFFALVEKYAATRKQTKGKKGRASAASKASRLSTQSNMTVATDAPSILSLGDAPAAEDDSILTTATTATTASKAGKSKKGASKARAGTKSKAKASRGKKTSTIDLTEPEPESNPMDVDLEAPDAEATPEPPKRAARRGTKQNASVLDASVADNASSQPKRATRTRANSKLKQPERLSDDQMQLHSELQAAIDASMNSDKSTPKPKRGTKRTSDGAVKTGSSTYDMESVAKEPEKPAAKPKKGRKPKKAPAESFVEPRSSELEEELQQMAAEEEAKKPSRANSKAKRGKKAKEAESAAAVEDQPQQPSPVAVTKVAATPPVVAKTKTPSPQQDSVASPPPPTPTPAKIAPPSANRSSPVRPRLSNQMLQPDRTPSAASNASDEENVPPSARPASSTRKPLASVSSNRQTRKVALAASTPTASPSKRANLLGGLKSDMPWAPTDLEMVFVPSPQSKKLGRSSGFGFGGATKLTEQEKENLAALDSMDDGSVSLDERIRRVKAAMTSPEKKMTVEQWISFNAQRGEERLRGECERLVGIFEREGGKALQSLEALQCVE